MDTQAFYFLTVHLSQKRDLTSTRQKTRHRVKHRAADFVLRLICDAAVSRAAITGSVERSEAGFRRMNIRLS
jgi:hypothetical protein